MVKLYRRILASYLCVCLIPLAFSLIVITNMYQETQKSVAKEEDTTLHTAQNSLESSLADASNTLDLLSQNGLMGSLGRKITLDAQELYSMGEIVQALDVANAKRDSYVSSFVYFPRSGYLISNKSTYHPELAELFTWDLGIDYTTLISHMTQSGLSVNVQTVYRKDGGGGYLLVSKNCYESGYQTIYDSGYQTVYASLGIIIQLEREESFLDTDTTKMFVLEEDGSLFCGGDYGELVAAKVKGTKESQGQVRVDGNTWMYSVYPAQSVSNLRYGLLMLHSAYFSALKPLLWQLGAELVLVVVSGVILAVFLSRRTWSPIQQVLPLVEKDRGGEEYRSLAEFSQALMDFAQEKEQLMQQLTESKARGNDLSIWRFLLGFTQDPSCLSRYLEESQPYRLLAISPAEPEKDPPKASVGEQAGEKADQDQRDLMDTLYKALERVFLDREDGVCLTIGAKTVVVLVQNTVDMEEIRNKVDQVQRETSQPLVCYVSDVCMTLEDAPDAWNWVKRACGRDSFWQHSRNAGVWLARDLLEYPGYFGDFPLHRKQLLVALASGKQEKLQKALETILGQDLLDTSLPVELIRHRCGSILEALLPYLEERDRNEGVQVMSAPTAEEMGDRLKELAQRVKFQDQPVKPEEKGNLLVAQVQEFIRENYQDPFLNVSLIADRLNRNLSTLSHQYKDLTGHGLLEELHTVRLEAAKRLLKEGKTVRETAELTGYGDSRALIRAFKRYEGSTPGQYVEKQ